LITRVLASGGIGQEGATSPGWHPHSKANTEATTHAKPQEAVFMGHLEDERDQIVRSLSREGNTVPICRPEIADVQHRGLSRPMTSIDREPSSNVKLLDDFERVPPRCGGSKPCCRPWRAPVNSYTARRFFARRWMGARSASPDRTRPQVYRVVQKLLFAQGRFWPDAGSDERPVQGRPYATALEGNR